MAKWPHQSLVVKPPDPFQGRQLDGFTRFPWPSTVDLYNLTDDQTEYQLRDRHSFSHFLALSPEGKVPDAKTIWLFREALKEHALVDELFAELNEQIKLAGYMPRQGQIVDASMVAAPRQRNSRDENAKIKQGETPKDWEDNPNKLRQKDRDAR